MLAVLFIHIFLTDSAECLSIPKGLAYFGTENKTIDNIECQRWDSKHINMVFQQDPWDSLLLNTKTIVGILMKKICPGAILLIAHPDFNTITFRIDLKVGEFITILNVTWYLV